MSSPNECPHVLTLNNHENDLKNLRQQIIRHKEYHEKALKLTTTQLASALKHNTFSINKVSEKMDKVTELMIVIQHMKDDFIEEKQKHKEDMESMYKQHDLMVIDLKRLKEKSFDKVWALTIGLLWIVVQIAIKNS